MLHSRARFLAAALVVLHTGCNVFDEKLEKRITQSDEGDAGPLLFELANACSATDLVRVEGSTEPLAIPITALTSNSKEAGECPISTDVLEGADGFFEIRAVGGERWHFHVDAAEGQNLAVLASRACDARECVASADVCGTNESEHFTFIPRTTGTYVVVVEGVDPSIDKPLTLLAVNPICGDGVKDHSEVCDDGNVSKGDGCDWVCRAELRRNDAEEVEPNDDTYGANVLAPPRTDRPIVVHGKVAGGACQPDYYLLRVPEERVLTAQVADAAGDPCTTAPRLRLSLIEADGDELRPSVELARTEAKGGKCPAIEEKTLAAGTYFLRLHHLAPADQYDYQLVITLTEP